jgi:CRP/FNR family transcriptional regulator
VKRPETRHAPLSLSKLPHEIEARLGKALRPRAFSAGERIFFQGDPATAIYLVARGQVKITRVTPEGNECILCVRGEGTYFCPVPLLDNGSHLGTAVAMSDGSLLMVDRGKFTELCRQSAELLAMVQGDCLAEIRRLLDRLESFAFRSVRERVAITLCNESRRCHSDDDGAVELQLTQQDLAALVGSTRESVARALKAMEHAGLVDLHRGRIRLRDIDKLAATSAEK